MKPGKQKMANHKIILFTPLPLALKSYENISTRIEDGYIRESGSSIGQARALNLRKVWKRLDKGSFH